MTPAPVLRVLVLLPGPRAEADAAFARLGGATEGVEFERLADCTENGLRERLARGGFQVLHFIGKGKSKAANYAVLELDASDGGARAVNVRHLGGLLAQQPALQLVVLQPGAPGEPFSGLATVLREQGVPAVLASGAMPGRLGGFASRLYGTLAAGQTLEQACRAAQEVLVADPIEQQAIRLVAARPGQTVGTSPPATGSPSVSAVDPRAAGGAGAGAAGAAAAPPVPAGAPVDPAEAARQRRAQEIHQALAIKRAAGRFDVFLCHNSIDKPAVKGIAKALKARGLLPWLDQWELPPGQPWQPLLEQQIGNIRAAAVFVGSAGVGPWQEQELYGFLSEFVSRRAPVIPLLLPDAPATPELPIFLKAMTYVDFRVSDPDPMARLEWGITGVRPDAD